MSTDKLLTLPQAAEYLGIKDHVLHNAFYRSNKTEPDPTYIRRRLYFNTSELDRIKNEGINKERSPVERKANISVSPQNRRKTAPNAITI